MMSVYCTYISYLYVGFPRPRRNRLVLSQLDIEVTKCVHLIDLKSHTTVTAIA